MKQLILGSSSPARRILLEKLGIPFEVASPDIDETPKLGETAKQLAKRLSIEKAKAVAKLHPKALIISCDQVASFEGHIYGKPLTHENAVAMLSKFSGKQVDFTCGLCLFNPQTQAYQYRGVPFSIHFKTLSPDMIEAYLKKDQPYFCAASIKVESVGIALVDKLEGDDLNALIGLPLVELVKMLENEGIDVLAES